MWHTRLRLDEACRPECDVYTSLVQCEGGCLKIFKTHTLGILYWRSPNGKIMARGWDEVFDDPTCHFICNECQLERA